MERPKAILGIETSCDETAAAVVTSDGRVLSNVLDSQASVHARFGGVVPELAARRHLERIEDLVDMAMRQADCTWVDLAAIAVTQGPGLAGALLVGLNFGKALAYASGVPLIAVNHLKGHLASAWLAHPDFPRPALMFVVSGGHTHLYYSEKPGQYDLLGKTVDDAAGEAFDKGAKMLGLGYPGGPALDRLARTGSPTAVHFPRPFLKRTGLEFSFSGLKTALLYYLRKWDGTAPPVADIAASYQEAIVDVLVQKAFRAVQSYPIKGLAVVGGVAANSRLRARLAERAAQEDLCLVIPPLHFCTDNAAMIAAAGWEEFRLGRSASWDMDVVPNWTTFEPAQDEERSSAVLC
ncbi:MAG: tRNA (adenosine(37)-N6)-threonylcarbamoyltransferase complex transferase subunit TsaD [Nitrospirae bacterium]|nr:MAG: tRNA (adenosine(37)-N6)-threonylcarbamoyltransferase complex transferase subunit TsaD [Nitrospirota bacterium]